MSKKHPHRILLLWAGPATSTTANLYGEMQRVLSEKYTVANRKKEAIHGSRLLRILYHLIWDLRGWPEVVRADALVFHSSMAVRFPSVFFAKILGKRIIVLHWDIYPTTIHGKSVGGPLSPVLDRLERFCVGWSNRVVVPSDDFIGHVSHPDMKVLPLWPSREIGKIPKRKQRALVDPIRIAFAGQTLVTRGLPNAIQRLGRERQERFELYLFAPQPPEVDLSNLVENVSVHYPGYLDRTRLAAALEEMDFGLISLHPGMDQVGFPSKVFDYAAAGLPVVYTGRALPAFSALLKRTGLGFTLGDESIDWRAARARFETDMPDSVEALVAETGLTLERLERAFFWPSS